MRYGRNAPCFCGSGKKYKHCHYGKPFHPEREVSLHQRNRIILSAAIDIFGFSKRRSWSDFKKNISGDQICRFYEVQVNLWTPETDWAAIMPDPDGKLRGLYLGDIPPELTLQNLIRFSLYSDHLFVIDPFHNPWILRPEYNPLENPDQYKADTLNLINFLFTVAPWIEAEILYLIPDPGNINVNFKWETAALAKERIGHRQPDERDLKEAFAVGRAQLRRALFALPEERLFAALEKTGLQLTDERKRQLLIYARQQSCSDPVAWERPVAENLQEGQMLFVRGGVNLETALLICDVTGAYPYTNMFTRWREIVEAREQMSETARVWSPLTKAFQDLDFRFLNYVAEIKDFFLLDSYVRDCNDRLKNEYRKAQADWLKIEESFVKWMGAGASVAAGFITGHLVPDVASLSAVTLNTLGQLSRRYFKREQFRKSNPMSVFIDLSRKEPPGLRIY
jgi:hypothetical protein